MLDSGSKAFFQLLAQSRVLKKLASRYGMRRSTSFARRFIAGETVGEAIATVRALEAHGLMHTLDHLGEALGEKRVRMGVLVVALLRMSAPDGRPDSLDDDHLTAVSVLHLFQPPEGSIYSYCTRLTGESTKPH